MRDRQRGYADEQIKFWPLLHPLMNGSEGPDLATGTLALVDVALVFHHPSNMSCPPAPTNMEIGWWLPLNQEGEKQDLWTEAYACSLQRVAEAATGRSWITEGEGMVPQISPLVQVFLAATGRHMSPHTIRECWPPRTQYCTQGTSE